MAQNKRPVVIERQQATWELRDRLTQPDLLSSIVLPIERDGKTAAVISLSGSGVSPYAQEAYRVEHMLRDAGVAELSMRSAMLIGLAQCLAMIPGPSRSGATILGALALGVGRRTAAEFSFFLAVPTMLGAATVKILKAGRLT